MLEVIRYVVLNPLRARMVRQPASWPWSSYCATIGEAFCPDWLTCDWILSQFGKRRDSCRKKYRAFVADGKGVEIYPEVRHQVILGDDAFVQRARAHISTTGDLSEVPRAQRDEPKQPLRHYLTSYKDRSEGMARAYLEGGYSLKAIAQATGTHYSTVSRAVNRFESDSAP